MMATIDIKQTRSVTKTIRTCVTLEQKQYEKILREAVGAPEVATVEIENNYGGDITIVWTEIIYDDDKEE